MNRRYIYVLMLTIVFVACADDVVSAITLLVEEDIIAIKGHCGSMRDSKVFTYVMREINKKIAAIPGFADRHDFELQQLITDTTNYNETYKTLCDNGGIQSDIFNSLITDGVVISPYPTLREQALNAIVYQLQTLLEYQQ
ncbi:MAG: hypothetical protein ACHQVS_00350 [Candidatus Babeliales bacterium]